MKIVKLKGGLGNQLFQYAFAKNLEKESREPVSLDIGQYSLLENDNIRVPRLLDLQISVPVASQEEISRVLHFKQNKHPLSFQYRATIAMEAMLNKKYFLEKSRMYHDCSTLMNYSYFDGYWQSYKYCDSVKSILFSEIKTRAPLSLTTSHMIDRVSSENSVFIGIRKGDYEKEAKHYGHFENEYYIHAMTYISKRVDNPVFYIFSNDIRWCKEKMRWDGFNVVYREPDQQVNDLEEFFLMKSCKNAIIINSTFHWWAAYLMDNPDKIVVHPSKWFFDNKPIDIYHPEWVAVD